MTLASHDVRGVGGREVQYGRHKSQGCVPYVDGCWWRSLGTEDQSVKLVSIDVRNYRSLFFDYDAQRGFSLELGDGMNAIAGPNNSGKSNLFRALALALDPDFSFDRARDMPAPWHYAKPSVTLTFQIPLRGAPGPERTLLKYLEECERKTHPKGRATYAAEGIVKLKVTIEGAENSSGSRRQVFVAKGAGNRSLQDDDPLFLKAIAQFHKCFHFVLIPSGQSLEGLMEGKFRDILRNVLREDLKAAYDAAEVSRTKYEADLQKGLLKPLTTRIHDELRELFPEIAEVTLRPDVRDLDETLTRMRVEVCDVARTDLSEKGTGVRGGFIVAMLRHFADVGKRSLLFAIEEPESFLHPSAQEMLREDLEALAIRPDVSLLVTTHSPYIPSRQPEAKVFAIEKDSEGRTVLLAEARGDEPQASVLGGLFRDRLVVELLDRANQLPVDTRIVVVVEGWTDRRYAEIALQRAGRLDLLDGLAFVEAGFGQTSQGAGGASLAVMQALVTRAMTAIPVVALFDNDAEGASAEHTLREIGNKTKDWKVDQTLFNYRGSFNGSNKSFPYEAEDLWPGRLLKEFVATDEEGRLGGKVKRPNPEGGWQFNLTAQAKGAFVEHLDAKASAADCEMWVQLYERMRSAAGL